MTNLEFKYIPYCKSTNEFINQLLAGKINPEQAIFEIKNLIDLGSFDINEINKLDGILKEEIEGYLREMGVWGVN